MQNKGMFILLYFFNHYNTSTAHDSFTLSAVKDVMLAD